MSEFFRGWRRKVGVATLVLAMIFTASWIRSLIYVDAVIVPTGERSCLELISSGQCFEWNQWVSTDLMSGGWSSYSVRTDNRPLNDAFANKRTNDWDLGFIGFDVGSRSEYLGKGLEFHMFMLRVPYWSIALPLICVSAWLILRKPRSVDAKSTAIGGQRATVESIEGTNR